MQIDIDFEVFKELTRRRTSESVTYNDVIRDLLGLEETCARRVGESLSAAIHTSGKAPDFVSRGLRLASGTRLRAKYRGQVHSAEIRSGKWLDGNGQEHASPSAAARAITGTNVNGLRFWEAQVDGESGWRKLDSFTDVER